MRVRFSPAFGVCGHFNMCPAPSPVLTGVSKCSAPLTPTGQRGSTDASWAESLNCSEGNGNGQAGGLGLCHLKSAAVTAFGGPWPLRQVRLPEPSQRVTHPPKTLASVVSFPVRCCAWRAPAAHFRHLRFQFSTAEGRSIDQCAGRAGAVSESKDAGIQFSF